MALPTQTNRRSLSTEQKIAILMQQAGHDRESGGNRQEGVPRDALRPINIRPLSDRGFGPTKIFRILLSNACVFSCAYCPMRAGRDLPRHAFPPEKLAEIFMEARRRGWSEGLFVTSGIPKSPVWAMDRMIALVELLRFRHRFAGYIHAKAVAGCREDQLDRLTLLVDRLSYNLESVCQATLDRVAPEKSLSAGLALMRRARRVAAGGSPRLSGDPRPPGPHLGSGITTQIVVGLDSRNDREILKETFGLWRDRTIHHSHYAAFRPISDTPLEGRPETPALREHRLYQADHLLRRYGFEPAELEFDDRGNLPFDCDPKMAWALAHSGSFPIEITTAGREALRRVPGLGPRGVERILAERKRWTSLAAHDLTRLGAIASRAAGFLSYRGKRLSIFRGQRALFGREEVTQAPVVYSFSPGTFR
ncbi:MAG: radical SAM protein [Thermoanaerobaculia bacterium]